jgi:hypothetical protein
MLFKFQIPQVTNIIFIHSILSNYINFILIYHFLLILLFLKYLSLKFFLFFKNCILN